ncbi:mycothiol synthase [Ruicaihuangia caeni]|uniref:mycothiol synthase n=1 Tax=Ruicaihuangia caeni TaxID=3042517 RepID=UPI00338D62B5
MAQQRVERETLQRSDPTVEQWLLDLARRAADADGAAPFNEASMLEISEVERFSADGRTVGAAMLRRDAAGALEAEFAVDPREREKGYGAALLDAILETPFSAWAHGDHPGARALAERYGLRRDRVLLQLMADLMERDDADRVGEREVVGANVARAPEGYLFDLFREGEDEAEWVALNARVFADHPEQGRITVETLAPRLAENGADDFLVARDAGGRMRGYCWLKLGSDDQGEVGEVYVIGVDPGESGRGLGRALLEAGLARLRARGIRRSNLYVEADNEPALRLYRAFGYRDHTVDVLYRRDADR